MIAQCLWLEHPSRAPQGILTDLKKVRLGSKYPSISTNIMTATRTEKIARSVRVCVMVHCTDMVNHSTETNLCGAVGRTPYKLLF
jgi:hypothetical protein